MFYKMINCGKVETLGKLGALLRIKDYTWKLLKGGVHNLAKYLSFHESLYV